MFYKRVQAASSTELKVLIFTEYKFTLVIECFMYRHYVYVCMCPSEKAYTC